jgi:YD repeat-containing protein
VFPGAVEQEEEPREERLDFFHKYVVDTVVRSGRMSANTQMVTAYEYVDGPPGTGAPRSSSRRTRRPGTSSAATAGSAFESATFEREAQSDPPRITKTITEPAVQGPAATRGTYRAYIVGAGVERDHRLLADNTWRTTRTETTYDGRGLVKEVNDLGDTATAEDDRCTTTTYTRDTGKWLLNLPGRVHDFTIDLLEDR